MADHHQFVVGSPTGETYSPEETGSVLEVGPNFVTIMTGIAYGPVTATVKVLDGEPEAVMEAAEWDVIEEASVSISKPVYVLTMDGEKSSDFQKVPIKKGLHRFRVSARGRDQGWDQTVTEPTEQYLIEVWKTSSPQQMSRLHKTDAAWEQDIVTHPKRNWWDPDPATDASTRIKYGYEQVVQWAKDEAIRWGGRPPSDKLRHYSDAVGVAGLDRALADAITRARPPKLRQIAAWGAKRAYTKAGIANVDWIHPALTALAQGEAPPHPFGANDGVDLWHAFQSEPAIDTTIMYSDDGTTQTPPPAVIAMPAIVDAGKEDPMRAAFRCLDLAARVDNSDYASMIADLRREFFPRLTPADEYERWI